ALVTYPLIVIGAWVPELIRAGRTGVTEPRVPRGRRRSRVVVAGLGLAALAAPGAAPAVVRQAHPAPASPGLARAPPLAAPPGAPGALWGTGANPEVGAILRVEAYRAAPPQAASAAMLNALTRLQRAIPAGVGQVTSIAVAPNGRIIAAAGTRGLVRLINART